MCLYAWSLKFIGQRTFFGTTSITSDPSRVIGTIAYAHVVKGSSESVVSRSSVDAGSAVVLVA